MTNSTKGEYIAVPTSDIDQEAALPAYSKEETTVIAVDNTQQKRRRRLRFMLIGGAVALFGLTQLCAGPMKEYAETRQLEPYENAPEPCSIRHSEQFSELKQHMDYLSETFGHHDEKWRPMKQDQEFHGKHHHKMHGKHHGKHHDKDESLAKLDEEEHHHHKMHGKHHGKHHDKDESLAKLDEEEHHHPKPFCRTQDLESTSTVLKFSPEDFSSADILSKSFFSPGSLIRLSQSDDESIQDVQVNVTVFTGRKELQKQVQVSAFDHNGVYTVQVEREHKRLFPFPPHRKPEEGDLEFEEKPQEPPHDGPHDGPHGPPHEKKEDCVYYEVDIVFPKDVNYFDALGLESKHAFIRGGKGLKNVEFGTVKAGVEHGAIIFKDLKAKKLMFGVLKGVVMGRYQPTESFSAGNVKGAVKVKIEPVGNVNITAASTFGPVSVDVPADKYSGDFTLFNLFGEPSSIQAPNPEDIHVTKFKRHIKSGYYKEEHTGSRIILDAKLHGGETLTFY